MKWGCEFALYIFPVTHICEVFLFPLEGIGLVLGVKEETASTWTWTERESDIYWSPTACRDLVYITWGFLGMALWSGLSPCLTEVSPPVSGRIGIQTQDVHHLFISLTLLRNNNNFLETSSRKENLPLGIGLWHWCSLTGGDVLNTECDHCLWNLELVACVSNAIHLGTGLHLLASEPKSLTGQFLSLQLPKNSFPSFFLMLNFFLFTAAFQFHWLRGWPRDLPLLCDPPRHHLSRAESGTLGSHSSCSLPEVRERAF